MSQYAVKQSFPVPGYGPGALAAPAAPVLKPTDGACVVNCLMMPSGQQLSPITTLYVDNSSGAVFLQITFPDTGMIVIVPAFTQGFYPVMTTSLTFTVAAPEIGTLGGDVSPVIQILNFQVPPQPNVLLLPAMNAGNVAVIGNPAGWETYDFHVPGTDLIYTSLQVDNSQYSGTLIISSTDIDGNAWEISQQGFTNSEIVIPPTAAGTPAIATATSPPASPTTIALIPTRWRVAFAGVASTSSLPTAFQANSVQFTSLPAGINDALITIPAGLGAYVSTLSIYAVGVSQPWTLILSSDPADPAATQTFLDIPLPAGVTQIIDQPLNYCTLGRGGSIAVIVTASSNVASCQLAIVLGIALVNASQNG
jgi:hypothetical protein